VEIKHSLCNQKNLKEVFTDVYTLPLLSEVFCKEIIKKSNSLGFEVNERESVSCQIPECILNEKDENFADFLLVNVIDGIANKFFKSIWGRIVNTGNVQVAKYDIKENVETHFHHDTTSEVTVVIPLNTGDYLGGGTEFKKHGIVKPLPTGHALFFPSFTKEHRGLQTTQGSRYLLVFWLKFVTDQYKK